MSGLGEDFEVKGLELRFGCLVDVFVDLFHVDRFCGFGGGSVFAVEVPEVDVFRQLLVSLALEILSYVGFRPFDEARVFDLRVSEGECLFHQYREARLFDA